ncbi:YihY family inner membrane protein [Candidatus Peregrinibacteria bacterium]|nr:YihY family inner membrane protein [Candidatus Peregrinibacteria bacterium]
MIELLKQTYKEWRVDRATLLSASLTFYTLFALAPILIIIIAVAGFFLGEQAIQGEISSYIQGMVGSDVATSVEFIIENAKVADSSLIFTIISIGIFLFGVNRLFTNLKIALNDVWDVKHQPFKKIRTIIHSKLISVLFVVGIGLLLVLALITSIAMATLGVYLVKFLPVDFIMLKAVNMGIAFLLITFVIGMIYKFIPEVKIAWNDVWIGALFTAVLFMFGNWLIGMYLRNLTPESVYGAAGSIIILLLWLYFSAQIFLFGAEFTKVYAYKYGSFSSKIMQWFHVIRNWRR